MTSNCVLGGSARRGRRASNLDRVDDLSTARILIEDQEFGDHEPFTRRDYRPGRDVTFVPWNNGKPRDRL